MRAIIFRKYAPLKIVVGLILLAFPILSLAQDRFAVSGTVRDVETKEVLVDVTVRYQGSSIATATDDNGYFELELPGAGTLLLTRIGYQTAQLAVNSSDDLSVDLMKQGENIDEVVVVAYGQQKKISVTGAVSSVGSDELKKTPTASLAVALAGRLPGLSSMQRGGGQPGRDDATMFCTGGCDHQWTAAFNLN